MAGQRLVVWGDRRNPPDWDGYLDGLIKFAMAEVERRDPELVRLATALRRVTEQKYDAL